MMTPRTQPFRAAWAVVLMIGLNAATARASALQIHEGRITVEAHQVPLQYLMQLVADSGIVVRIDPDINPLVTLSFRDRNLEDGLKAMLRPHNHVFFWRTDPSRGSSGDRGAYRLAEIHIFRPGRKERMVALEPPPTPPEPGESAESASAPVDTKVLILDNKVFVPVVLGYQGREIETTLIFDTGAGSIVLHQNVAEQLAIETTETSKGRGVGGIEIESRMARLDYVRVGPHRKENLRADIVAYQGTAEDHYNGLLGMNFLRGLTYTIDFDRQVIRWGP